MRLLRADGKELVRDTAYGEHNEYAILSHRWLPDDEQEVRYADMVNRKDDLRSKPGWRKLQWCRRQAVLDGLPHIWADTVCIDKSSSQELTESINSMYQWYEEARICYVCLQDMPKSEEESDFRRSDLYAVDVNADGARLLTRRINVSDYDTCPCKTFGVLRDPTHDQYRGNARN